MDPARAFDGTYPTHQWVAPDAPDAYTPMANGLSLLSNGYGFYEALSAPPRNLCKPQTAGVDDYNNLEFQFQPHLEIICCCDQSRTTRFFSPEESSTPPGTPASTAASAPSPSTSTSTSDMDRCPSPSWATAISTEDARHLMETCVRHSTWFQTNAMEPSVGDDGVPTFARLLTRPGESVYRCFVDTRKDRKGKPVYYCSDCGFKSDRLHRLIGHQRSKRGHRPFACPDEGWRVHPLLLPQTLRPSDPHHPAPRTPFRSVGQLLIARVVFVVVIFADTPRRVWVTIGVIEMACSPASSAETPS